MSKTSLWSRLAAWTRSRRLDIAIVAILVAICGTVSAVNMTGYPQRFEDEGTYISQAWAIKEQGTLTHYTYWYDHPPVGWIQIAAYLMISQGLERYDSAITAGREFMLVVHLISVVLLYALARRMKIARWAAVFGVLLFGLSPLSVEFSRYVFLDNVALPWILSAFFLALSPRRSLQSAIGAAVCAAIAILSKETLAVLLPVILYCLWAGGDKRNRRYTITVFGVVFAMITAAYVLYAFLKNELIPGEGHVSLIGSLYWQLAAREGSGSILEAGTKAYGLFWDYWLARDYVLVLAGVLGLIPALIVRSLRPVGLALLIGLAILLRGGHLPFPYILAILPFAALCAAGAADQLGRIVVKKRLWAPLRFASWAVAAEIVAALIIIVVPMWYAGVTKNMSRDDDYSSRQAVQWIADNIPRDNRLIVESALWSDLEDKGFDVPKPVWLYKTETDPAVSSSLAGGNGIDYVVLNGKTVNDAGFDASFPKVSKALKEGELVKQYGSGDELVLIYKVSD